MWSATRTRLLTLVINVKFFGCISGDLWFHYWMKWTCKFCDFLSYNEKTIFKHYKDKHGRGRTGFVCIYPACFTVFQSHVELGRHLKDHKCGPRTIAKIRCELCSFSAPTSIKCYFLHLKRHLINKETVTCPFVGCSFKSRVAPTFTAHRSRSHQLATINDFKPELICQSSFSDEPDTVSSELFSEAEPDSPPTQKTIERRIAMPPSYDKQKKGNSWERFSTSQEIQKGRGTLLSRSSSRTDC